MYLITSFILVIVFSMFQDISLIKKKLIAVCSSILFMSIYNKTFQIYREKANMKTAKLQVQHTCTYLVIKNGFTKCSTVQTFLNEIYFEYTKLMQKKERTKKRKPMENTKFSNSYDLNILRLFLYKI